MKNIIAYSIVLGLFLGGPLYIIITKKINLSDPWWKASRDSAKIAVNSKNHNDAIVQIYAARAYGWRGALAVHTWFSIKKKGEKRYTVYQAIGWNTYMNRPIVDVRKDIPDRIWFGNKPWILFDKRGSDAEKVITEIEAAVKKYPFKNNYLFWPGPNSNTFTAYVIRNAPSIDIRLPLTAIGKDFLGNSFYSKSISKTGYQFSLRGLFGITIANIEGIEINLFTFSFSINKKFPYIHLPGID